jgi:hypothetical protein
MSRILPFVKVTDGSVRLEVLKTAIEEMLSLIEEASQFLIEYEGEGARGMASTSKVY